MGKPDHMYRPFLRVGNSPHLPAVIRRYIGSVILSDRLTGNYFIEASCLETSAPQPTNYVGPGDLIEAIAQFTGNTQIVQRPLSFENKKDRNKGGNVVFYVDGNFRILLDGHRLFDLFEQEKADHHQINTIQRIEDHVNKTEGAPGPADLQGSGFILLQNNTLALFQDGTIQSCNLKEDSLASLGMFPPSMLRCFGGASNKTALLNISKWHKIQGNTIELVLNTDENLNENKDEQQFLSFMKQAGQK